MNLGSNLSMLQRILLISVTTLILAAIELTLSNRRSHSSRRHRDKHVIEDWTPPSASHNVSSTLKFQETVIHIPSNDNDDTVQRHQRERHELLSSACAQLPPSWRSRKPDWEDFLVDDQRRYIYCKVEKVACTSWKRTLLEVTGDVPNASKLNFYRIHSRYTNKYLRELKTYRPTEIAHRLKTYYKFMFTRDPFERLVSAYRSKIVRDKMYKRLRERLERRRKTRGESGSEFASFVRYITDKAAHGKALDVHWRPQSDICRPCLIDYDFIGHYETLYDDADHVLATISARRDQPEMTAAAANSANSSSSISGRRNSKDGDGRRRSAAGSAPRVVKFPRSDPDNKRAKSGYLVGSMMNGLKKRNVQRINNLYDRDFQLFGYKRR